MRGSSTVQRDQVHHCMIFNFIACDTRPRRFGGLHLGGGTR